MKPHRLSHAFTVSVAFLLPILSACAHRPHAQPEEPFIVKLIALNDFHGNLQSPGTLGRNAGVPAAARPPVGGADVLAAYVTRLKAQNPLHAVVAAGDLIGASPLVSSLFHDEPTVEVLNRIGLDFSSVGNHEFDKGAAELLRLQRGHCFKAGGHADPNSCKGAQVGTPVPFEGAHFQWLSANVVATGSGETLLPAYAVKKFNGVPVAFIGMTLKATPTIVTPTGVAGLEFRDEADTVNALVPHLRRHGIEAIVVLLHEGGTQTGAVPDIDGCDGNLAGSAVEAIVKRLDDAVDLVVSGHTHAAYNCRLANRAGRAVPVTSANSFGRVLTDIDLTLDPRTRDITAVHAANVLVDRSDTSVAPDPQILGIVNAYAGLAAPLANQVIGTISTDVPGGAGADAACNMAAGELIADSQLAATRAAGLGGAEIALMNRGGVRTGFTYAGSTAGEGDGNITYGEAFTVQPFGNSLVTLSLSAQDLKNVLEQQFAGCRGQLPTATRLMVPSAGFSYTWDGSKACDTRISNVHLRHADGSTEVLVDAQGSVADAARRYRVTVNNFMASGGDGFSTFTGGTGQLGGAQDIDALIAYLAATKPPNAPYDPAAAALSKPRLTRVGAVSAAPVCPGGVDTNP